MKIRKITHKGKTYEIHETPTKLEVKEEGDTRWTRISNQEVFKGKDGE